MKRHLPTDLGRALFCFFQEYLPVQKGVSINSLRNYRDSVLLLLRYMAEDSGRRFEALELSDLTAERVTKFLRHLETVRHNSIATRNTRLAAVHALARFLISKHPEHMAALQGVLGLPFKRGAQKTPIDYLEMEEVEALLNAIDRATPSGQRDYALFALMLNTGARVQEILDLKVSDVRFCPPYQVRLVGKGNKIRVCPIWPRTAKLLEQMVSSAAAAQEAGDKRLFLNRRGEPMTRFGVRYLLRKHLPNRGGDKSSGLSKRLHPHALRHTTAVYLLKAGVDFATIGQWLGHATLNTTMRYAKADMDLKRQALAQVFPETLSAPTAGKMRLDGSELADWLRRL
jgi:site-specific recombinase XerD